MRLIPKRKLVCSFCRKSDREVRKLIAGPRVHICDSCVGICNRILDATPASFSGWEKMSDAELLTSLKPSEAGIEAMRSVLQTQIDTLRKREVSWAEIGAALGISRQAAWERFS